MATMSTSGFLGAGWAFPVRADTALARGEETVRQSIWIILSTARGERVMRPDFGCGIHDLVFGLGDATTASLVADEVRGALRRWEPRIEVTDVQVRPDGDGSVMLISITYEVLSTNSVFNMVYPFYLESGEAAR